MRHNQAGFSLIEILISLCISLLVISLLLETYLAAHRSIRLQNALHDMQQNANAATHLFKREMLQAGQIGCAKLTSDFPVISHTTQTLRAFNKISGNEHELTVRYAQYPHAVLVEGMQDRETLLTDATVLFAKGDIVIISNCQRADIFTIKKSEMVHGKQRIHAAQPLDHLYEPLSEVSLLAINRYFVGKTQRHHFDGTPVSALYVQDIHGIKTEVVPEIEKLKITWHGHQSQITGIGMVIDMAVPPLKKTWYFWSRTEWTD